MAVAACQHSMAAMDYGEAMARGRCNSTVAVEGGDGGWRLRLTAAWTTAVATAAVGKDASATTATTPVRQGHCHGCSDGKDASNRGNVTSNSQRAQRKEKRADKRSGSEDATQGNRAAVKGLLPMTVDIPS